MAFHDHLSQEMALHYADQQLNDNVAVLRGMLPEHLGGTGQSSAEKPTAPPTWLNSAILRQHQHHYGGSGGGGGDGGGSFLHLQTTNSDSSNSNNQWMTTTSSRPIENDDVNNNSSNHNNPVSSESMMMSSHHQEKGGNNHNNNNNAKQLGQSESDGNGNHGMSEDQREWEMARCKADILGHPMYDELLSAHVSCLRIATPVDQLPRIDAQLAQSQQVLAKYSVLAQGGNQPLDDKDLNQFMVIISSFLVGIS